MKVIAHIPIVSLLSGLFVRKERGYVIDSVEHHHNSRLSKDKSSTQKEQTMHEYLKVKVKSLAVESRIIRQEEIKAKRAYKWNRDHDGNPEKFNRLREGLYEHRVGSLRNESRISHLAYGFLKKVSYKAMENKCGTDPDWDRIARLIKKYGEEDNRILMQKFSAWKEEE